MRLYTKDLLSLMSVSSTTQRIAHSSSPLNPWAFVRAVSDLTYPLLSSLASPSWKLDLPVFCSSVPSSRSSE